MFLTIGLGVCGVLCIVTQPVRLLWKRSPFAALGSKVFASTLFCLAGAAAAAQRTQLNWQAAALLFGFCLACLGDTLLAMEPVLARPEQDRNYVFTLGALPFFLANCIQFAVLASKAQYSAWLLLLLLPMPLAYLILQQRKVFRFGKLAVPLTLYSVLLGALVWAAVQTQGTLRALAIPAAVLFCVSDTALFYFNFGSEKKPAGAKFTWLVMVPYYAAQALMACVLVIV